ncbi:LamG-like jellyroll fold domain-containing protein [Actinomadura rubrisoli]|uniref:LamG domain-containing protein n=1 Tax=Actinomadura rubrisoli TaxID=2530368 RepID=A0A4R5BJ89_9ACTN|nr:LamG-like jellyroll fold domain-containing protein [Actinomadura rubrisoli]TDD85393.1 LamG domain-containing protein [Actinomadura rubrisoli]
MPSVDQGKARADKASTASTEAKALVAARKTDQRVEVLDRRSETEQLFAEPDGSLTYESTVLPKRVHRSDGSWAAVDDTLERKSDGSVGPVSSTLNVRLSGGGDSALAKMTDAERSLAFTWSSKLPKPTLDGSTAIYPNVLPDVDLRMTASELGWSEVLVVKTAEAAANPDLAKLTFGLDAEGVTARKNDSGGFDAVTAGGVRVFHSSPPMMWDSSGRGAAVVPDANDGVLAAAPKLGARRSRVGLDVTSTQVSVVPDPAMLTSGSVKFPLYIDPDVVPEFAGKKLAWTYVDRAYPSTKYWNSTHQPEAGNYGSGLKRSFFRMASAFGSGTNVIDAAFYITQNKSWGCTSSPQAVDLYLTGAVSSSTSWNNQPSWSQKLGSIHSDGGYNSSCPDAGLKFDVKSLMARTKGGWSNTTFGLRDYDDTNSSEWGWKGFVNDPKLVVHYNHPPAVPTGYATTPGTRCMTGAGRPAANADGSTASPMYLNATVYDPDKSADPVRAEFTFHHYNKTTAVWDDLTSQLPNGGKTAMTSLSKPTPLNIKLPRMTNGDAYSWRVRAYDGTNASGYTPWCEFSVDTFDPQLAPQVSSVLYPDDQPTSTDDYHGGVGVPGEFVFAPGTGETDVTGYKWAMNDTCSVAQSAATVAAPGTGQPLKAQIAPNRDWDNFLSVLPVDAAGNVGTRCTTYTFKVKHGAASLARWRLDETGGTTAADSSDSAAHPAALSGGASWTGGGRLGRALHLDGSSGIATATGSPAHTDKALTVSGWARLSSNAHNATIVSQQGATTSAFVLYYSSGAKRWRFNMQQSDGMNPVIDYAESDADALLNSWTHLVGVYDSTRQQLRLYVNGILQSKAGVHSKLWDATGNTVIGRELYQGVQQNYFTGDVDDVQIWDRILSDSAGSVVDPFLGSEIAAMAKQPPAPRGYWALNEAAGTASGDGSGFGHPLALGATTTWGTDGSDGTPDLVFDGQGTSTAMTDHPVVRSDGSYAVSAWVKLPGTADACTLPNRASTAVAQMGNRLSGYYLGYRPYTENGATVGRWAFTAPSLDQDTGAEWTSAISAEPVDCEGAAGTFTHLVGVYDRPARELRLYVNGQLTDTAAFTPAWNSGGALRIGSAWYRAAPADFWIGEIDDVRLYIGTLTDSQVVSLFFGSPPT